MEGCGRELSSEQTCYARYSGMDGGREEAVREAKLSVGRK